MDQLCITNKKRSENGHGLFPFDNYIGKKIFVNKSVIAAGIDDFQLLFEFG
jgi:hypothetical protein